MGDRARSRLACNFSSISGIDIEAIENDAFSA
jgi:hypothetical protein